MTSPRRQAPAGPHRAWDDRIVMSSLNGTLWLFNIAMEIYGDFMGILWGLPSGKLTVCYGKSPFLSSVHEL